MKRILYRHILLLLIVATGASCSRHGGGKLSLRQAQYVVAQADSLWHEGQMYGVDAGDSATLAQAYLTLNDHSSIYSFVHCTSSLRTSFAHACYHYGRLLRAKENPVEAMQAFIAATHSRTRDYHILGRVYSNMGDICHLAGEFQLSYDMFEKSAEMFLKNGDTLLYYYDLNNMAFELAEQGDKEETFNILSQIKTTCTDESLSLKMLETITEVYIQTQNYDSAIFYARKIQSANNSSLIWKMQLAQAYSFLHINDSATYYANIVIAETHLLQELNNALYILTNDDIAKEKETIRETAAKRADTQKLLEIRHGKLSQATQLLEQDLVRTPDWKWLYATAITVFVIMVVLLIYFYRKRCQHALLSQKIDNLRHETKSMQEKHEQIVQEHNGYTGTLITQIERNCKILLQTEDFPNNIHWKDYNAMCKIINDNCGNLTPKLQTIYHLSEREIRLCVLVLLGISNSEQLAERLHYGSSGIRNFKNRTAKKLGTNSIELRNILLNIAVGEIQKVDK